MKYTAAVWLRELPTSANSSSRPRRWWVSEQIGAAHLNGGFADLCGQSAMDRNWPQAVPAPPIEPALGERRNRALKYGGKPWGGVYPVCTGSFQSTGGSGGKPSDFITARATSSSPSVLRAASMRTAMSWFIRHHRMRLDIVTR
jgi:hypothetical protein